MRRSLTAAGANLFFLTDTATGAVRTYRNPAGEICGGADVEAF